MLDTLEIIDGQASPIDVREWIMQNKACYLFDLRPKEEAQTNPAKPFQNIPFQVISKIIPQIDTDNTVFLLCEDTTKSTEAQKIFASCGISSYVVHGGTKDWLRLFPNK